MWWIVRKEVHLLLGDTRAAVILVALPVVFMAVIGVSTSDILSDDDRRLGLTIVDRDGGELSARVVEVLRRRSDLDVTEASSVEDAEERLASQQCDAIVIVGETFSERVADLRPGDVLDTTTGPLAEGLSALDFTIEAPPSLRNTRSIVEGLVFGEVVRVCAAHVARGNRLTAWFLRGRDEADETSADTPAPSEPPPPPGPGLYQQIVPSYTVLFAFFLVTTMSRAFLAERELHTLDRLRIAPISTYSLLAGKTLPYLMVSVLQCSLLLGIGGLLFGMNYGPRPWLLLPILLGTSLTATSLGLLIAALVRTDAQVSAYATFVILVMGGVSGCMVPREFLPKTMREISLVVPHAWALDGFREVLVQPSPSVAVVVRCSLALLGFAAVFAGLGAWRLSRVWSNRSSRWM